MADRDNISTRGSINYIIQLFSTTAVQRYNSVKMSLVEMARVDFFEAQTAHGPEPLAQLL